MTLEKFLESAKTIESVAKKHLGEFINLYHLERFDSSNIEFYIPDYKLQEVLELVPNETNDFITYIQFCYCYGEWKPCTYDRITNVGIYKKHKGWLKNEVTENE